MEQSIARVDPKELENINSDEHEYVKYPQDQQLMEAATFLSLSSGSEKDLTRKEKCHRFLSILGPGLMVCLADTDGPCLITAASSGSEYGYSLLLTQLLLIPVLYAAQELTVRLALVKQMGLTELLLHTYGKKVAWTACIVLLITCVGALISEFSAIGQVGLMWGIPAYGSSLIMMALLLGLVFYGGFRTVEKIGVALGCCQLIFIPVMFIVKPNWLDVLKGLGEFHFNQMRWVELVAANIGAVIMPWMLYYQQSACVQRGLTVKDIKYARLDTGIGSFVTQMVMSSMVVVLGATKYITHKGELTTLEQILDEAMADSLGKLCAKILLSFGIIGACLVAAIVVTICPAWSLCEVMGQERQLGRPYHETKCFYNSYIVMLALSAIIASIPKVGDATWLSIQVEILNALLMPAVVFFIFVLCINRDVLPENYRLKGLYKYILGTIFTICSGFCLYACVVDAYDAIKN